MIIIIAIIAGVIVLDQVTKILAAACLEGEPAVSIIPEFLRFSYLENRGAAWGMLADHRWVFMVFSTIAIAALAFFLIKYRPKSLWVRTALSFIIAGGIGNMIDRVFRGYVVDFISVKLYYIKFNPLETAVYNFPVFNVADSFVCIGACMLIVWLLVDTIRESREKKKASLNAKAESEQGAKEESDHDVSGEN